MTGTSRHFPGIDVAIGVVRTSRPESGRSASLRHIYVVGMSAKWALLDAQAIYRPWRWKLMYSAMGH